MSLPRHLEELLAAQERVDALRDEAVRRAGATLADLAYANSYDGAPPEVRQALREAIDAETTLDLQYTPYGGATVPRRLVAEALGHSHGERFTFRDVILTSGLSTLCFAMDSQSASRYTTSALCDGRLAAACLCVSNTRALESSIMNDRRSGG